jgi:hypothetical protein
MSKPELDYKPLSKTGAYAKIRALQGEMEDLVQEMYRVAEAFAAAVRNPPLNLTLQRQRELVYLRWRRPGVQGAQPYLLLESPKGKAWLDALDEPSKRMYLKFARIAMSLNFSHSSALSETRFLKRYIEHLDALPDS